MRTAKPPSRHGSKRIPAINAHRTNTAPQNTDFPNAIWKATSLTTFAASSPRERNGPINMSIKPDHQERVRSGQAWDDFCESLKDAKRFIFRPEAPTTELDRAE